MTPKEKAKELVDRFWLHVNELTVIGNCPKERMRNAKQCALICVEETINFGNKLGIREPMMYWYKVKQEIERL